MADLKEIIAFLDQMLHADPCADESVNGLQVDAQTETVTKIGYAVDSGQSVIETAPPPVEIYPNL